MPPALAQTQWLKLQKTLKFSSVPNPNMSDAGEDVVFPQTLVERKAFRERHQIVVWGNAKASVPKCLCVLCHFLAFDCC
jgi:hypothetical protein